MFPRDAGSPVSLAESGDDAIEIRCRARPEDSDGLHWTMSRGDAQDLACWWSAEDSRVKNGQRSVRDKECGKVLVSMFTPSVIHVRVRDRFGNVKVVGYSLPRAVLEHLGRWFSQGKPESDATPDRRLPL